MRNYKKILILISPIIPHFSSEALMEIGVEEKLSWPKYNENNLLEKIIPIVVQINGKKRDVLNVDRNSSEDEIFSIAINDKNINKHLINKTIKKKIFVPNRLINIII